jgi:uncharacterized phosphosugar-binding protein
MRERINMKIKISASVIAVSLLLMLSLPACLNFPSTANRGAEACYRQLNTGLDHLREQLPAITKSAEHAAEAYVRDGFAISSSGEPGLVSESLGRAGGLIAITKIGSASAAKTKTIVLLFPSTATLEKDLTAMTEIQKQGGIIILFGKSSMTDAAEKAGLTVDCFIDTGFPRPSAGHDVVEAGFPADSIMNMTALWCWTGEFVAACTRLGKMPPLYQSYSVPGSRERAEKLRGSKFHSETPEPVLAGTLGNQYLSALKESLTMLNEKELGHIRLVAKQAESAVRSGHTAYISAVGHAVNAHMPLVKETGHLSPFKADTPLNKGDFIFAIAYDDILPKLLDDSRKAEAVMAWSLTDYKTAPGTGPGAIPPGQIFINQRWALGDAVVTAPKYDINILPSSGVIAETILWMTLAEIDLLETSN